MLHELRVHHEQSDNHDCDCRFVRVKNEDAEFWAACSERENPHVSQCEEQAEYRQGVAKDCVSVGYQQNGLLQLEVILFFNSKMRKHKIKRFCDGIKSTSKSHTRGSLRARKLNQVQKLNKINAPRVYRADDRQNDFGSAAVKRVATANEPEWF
ncbi:MAG: hypothetical protein RSB03_06585 [Oscillospiraceae bacterium]